MKFRYYKIKLIFFLSISSIFFPCHVYSFSLGEISLKSSFGEKFHAQIIVKNDAIKGLKVFIGSHKDYATMDASRSRIVDKLYIVEPIEFVSFDEQLIKIVSDKPLFYPSFTLVIKAELDDGTILEKYSLVADFKKNMSLFLSPLESKEKTSTETTELHETIPEDDKPEGYKIDSIPPLKEEEKKLAIEKVEKKRATSEEEEKEEEEEIVADQIATEVSVDETIEQELDPMEDETQPEESFVYEVSPKDNLSTILKNIRPQKSGFYRAVVALWKLNKDQFAYNNINNLKINARLSFDNLDEEISKVTNKEANQTIREHQVQWKKILLRSTQTPEKTDAKEADSSVIQPEKKEVAMKAIPSDKKTGEKDVDSSTMQPEKIEVVIEAVPTDKKKDEKAIIMPFPLPGETQAAAGNILPILNDWRQSWENKNFEKHFSYYSENFLSHNYRRKNIDLAGWKQYKSRISRRNNIKIDVKNLHIRKEGSQIIVSFLQKFSSDSLMSIGTKIISFEKENGKLKITKETFQNEETEIVYKHYPFVVHTSSHKAWASAVNSVNRLREAGFAAYIVKATIPRKGVWFRIVIDRFRSREDAKVIARKLKKNGINSYASVIRLPYAISLGSFENEEKAYHTVKIFRKKKYSPYLFSRGEENEIKHHVLVGGYSNKKQAMKVSKILSKKGVPHEVVLP